MRSRAAILPYPGDPFLLKYWIHNYKTFWERDIDALYIILNTEAEDAVIQYIRELCAAEPKVRLTYVPQQIQHGDAINMALDILTEDVVMLIEDDCYVFKPGVINECFLKIETGQYDLVGSKRGSCSMEILKRAEFLWDVPFTGDGDQGPNFWPNLLFTKAATLRGTDRNFNSRAWTVGEKIHALSDYDVEVPVIASDTLVNTSLQLRATIPKERIAIIPQYHASPDDLGHFETRKYLFDGFAPWTHIGSLSSGCGGALMDGYSRSLSRRSRLPEGPPTELPAAWCDKSDNGSRLEWERRTMWWAKFHEFAAREPLPEYIQEFHAAYGAAIAQLIAQYRLRMDNIQDMTRIYRSLGL